MADVKISALPASTTPLAGTEVLPIVQSSTTKQVSVANLTAGRAISASSLTLTTPLSAANGGTGLTSLTAGYIPFGNGAGAFSSSSGFVFDGSNLGINNTSPAYRIDVIGNGVFTKASSATAITEIMAGSSDYSSAPSYRSTALRQYSPSSTGTVFGASAANTGLLIFQNTSIGIVGTNGATPLVFGTLDTERMRIASDGSVGIGTSSPTTTLDVVKSTSGGVTYARVYNSDAGASSGAQFNVQQGAVTCFMQAYGNSGAYIGTITNHAFNISTNSTPRVTVDTSGNIYGTSGTTGMTNGFFYMPAAAGAPSGTPTSVSGRIPFYYDTTNNKFYVYNGAWKAVTLA